MYRVRINGRKKYEDAVALLTKVGGMFHGVPSTSRDERVLVVSNQQYEALVEQDLVDGQCGASEKNGIEKSGR